MFEGRPDRTTEIVLVGRSNVGKSTLMRELTGHQVTTGRKPGVTRSPNYYDWAEDDFLITDLPGFGFMEGVSADQRDTIKTDIVAYLETYADQILVAVLVLDANSAVDIIDRHTAQDDVPYVLDMYRLLDDLAIPVVIAVNKIDKVDDRDAALDAIGERFGLLPPWQQWTEIIAPVNAKAGRISALNEALRDHLHANKRDDLLKHF